MTFEAILSGGDDYELMFTANPNKEFQINTLSNDLNLKISKIERQRIWRLGLSIRMAGC